MNIRLVSRQDDHRMKIRLGCRNSEWNSHGFYLINIINTCWGCMGLVLATAPSLALFTRQATHLARQYGRGKLLSISRRVDTVQTVLVSPFVQGSVLCSQCPASAADEWRRLGCCPRRVPAPSASPAAPPPGSRHALTLDTDTEAAPPAARWAASSRETG